MILKTIHVIAVASFLFCSFITAAQQKVPVYVGTYTRKSSKGIYLLYLDIKTGRLESAGLAGKAENPSFLAVHPDRMLLYAVSEVSSSSGQKGGAISAFKINPETYMLNFINQESSCGKGPCHVIVDHSGKCVLTANYGSGSIACLPIRPDGGVEKAASTIQHKGSSINPRRQKGPHAHSINVDPENRFAYVADLGLDKVLIYKFDADSGKLAPNNPGWIKLIPGSGPRHFSFHPTGSSAYVINELSSKVTAFSYNKKDGVLTTIQTISTLPENFKSSNSTAEIQVHPSGRFLYGSNRGHNSIAIFQVNPKSGKLIFSGCESTQGKTPRNFGIDPTGAFLLAANQSTDNIVVFKINQKTGALNPTGHSIKISSPVCIKTIKISQLQET